MFPPGAPISGFNAKSGERPYELNDEINPPVGLTKLHCWSVQVIITGATCARMKLPSASEMPTTGVILSIGEPSVPLKTPGLLLEISTATAPAAMALAAFIAKEHVPREAKATLPVKSIPVKALHASPTLTTSKVPLVGAAG